MKIHRRNLVLLSTAMLLTGCVSSSVQGMRTRIKDIEPAEKLLIVIAKGGKFKENNLATINGQENLDALIPNLFERLPAVFTLNGLPSRAIVTDNAVEGPAPKVHVADGESVLFVTPKKAWWRGARGEGLQFSISLLTGYPNLKPAWKGTLNMNGQWGVTWDAKAANDVAIQMLETLRVNALVTVPKGELRTE